MKVKSIAALTLLSASLTSASLQARAREEFERVVPFELGGRFSVENVNGSIDIETWNEGSVRIEAVKEARSEEDLRDIEILVEGSGSDVSVRTVHPRRRGGGEVSYRILLPEEAQVGVVTVNGAVSVRGVRGGVRAESVNGGLKIEEIDGDIDAETTNGSIHASYRQASGGSHRFETTNGSVRIYLPPDAGGELEVDTSNGSIEVDFPMTLTRSSRQHVEGSFGSGSGSFQVETVNGSVKLLRN